MARDILISSLETVEYNSAILLARLSVNRTEAAGLCMKLMALERNLIDHAVLRAGKQERCELRRNNEQMLCAFRDGYTVDFKPHLSFLIDTLLNFYNEQYTEAWHWDLDMPLIGRVGEVQFILALDFGS